MFLPFWKDWDNDGRKLRFRARFSSLHAVGLADRTGDYFRYHYPFRILAARTGSIPADCLAFPAIVDDRQSSFIDRKAEFSGRCCAHCSG